MTQLARFQKRINDVIPLTRGLGVQLITYDGHQLLVSAPLEPNRNHQGTGFGGSLYAVAVTCAWGLVELTLEDFRLAGNVVIQSGTMGYTDPVDDDFYAICHLPGEEEMARFRKSLARYGKGRLTLSASVYCGTPTSTPKIPAVATFRGRFVVQDARTIV